MNKRLKKKNGLSKIRNEELWDLDITLAKYILPRLKKFRDMEQTSIPNNCNTMEEWLGIINKMIWSFEKHLNYNLIKINKDNIRYKEGLRLFAEYFGDLWD